MNETTCRIGQLGKKLVHYILFKGQLTPNAPIVTNKEVLTKQLQEMKAVLVHGYLADFLQLLFQPGKR